MVETIITLLRVIPTMTFIHFVTGISSTWQFYLAYLLSYLHCENYIDISHSLCKQAIAFFFLSATLLAGLPLHSRMSPGVTACSSGCKTDMPRHAGDHLNHSCHVGCSTAWKSNMPGHCGKPSESVMECYLQMRLDKPQQA